MSNTTYFLSKKSVWPFSETVDKVREALRQEGFGIITEIDLQETFKRKLDINFRKYLILGACNPRFAYEALLEEDKLGVFLPCNVVVQEHLSGAVEVLVINPEEMMRPVDNLNLKTFGTEVKQSLQGVLDNI